MGGFKSRLSYHLRDNKKPHWHIDYLLEKGSLNEIILYDTRNRKVECAMAQTLSHVFDSVLGFGSSDCKCYSHLFFAADRMKSNVIKTLISLPIKELDE
jgi:Uri superfamily endonuclease